MKKEIISNPDLVARCGLYCGACGAYLNNKCPGCAKNEKAGWCAVRSCCNNNRYKSCADCTMVSASFECSKLNNFISKAFSFLFRSNRNACIARIREIGINEYANEMSQKKAQTIKSR